LGVDISQALLAFALILRKKVIEKPILVKELFKLYAPKCDIFLTYTDLKYKSHQGKATRILFVLYS